LRSLTPDEERAFRLLGITADASPDDVRRAYKEKLKYYHPDRYAGNPVLSKVANDKTREVVAAYALVSAWIEEGASRR
jgi:curved DNA-binding protein CbpA